MTSQALIDRAPVMRARDKSDALELSADVSELRYRRLFEAAQDGILILDAQSGKIIDANPFLLDLLDYPFERIVGRQLWEIGLFEDIAANHAVLEKLQTEGYIRYEDLPLRTKSGQKVQVEIVSNVYLVGSAKSIQCNIRDISERAKFQAALKSHTDTLELAAKARDEANAVLFHELRNPLAAISSMIDLLEMGQDTAAPPDQTELPAVFDKAAIAFIRRNVQSLVRLLNELLDFTHVANDASALELVKVNVHQVIRFALKNLESQQHGTGIGIELRLEAARRDVRGDALKLEQVVANLIGNALKFTPRGGKVSIVTRNEGNDTFVVEVSDTGIGISAEALSRIFSPFEQGNSSIHARYGGLGLGLSIAQTLTQAQGGTLEAASEGVDKGARFIARFKLDESISGKPKGDDPHPARTDMAAPSRNGDGIYSGISGNDGKEPTHSNA